MAGSGFGRAPGFAGLGEGGVGFFLEFLELAGETGFGGGIHAVDEENAVQVIDLVLGGAGEEAGAVEADFVAVERLGVDGDFFGAADLGADFGDAEAAFAAGLFADRLGEDGVHQDQGHRELRGDRPGEFGFGDVDDGKEEGLADLLGGEADAFGGVHGLHHVGGELPVVGGDVVEAFAFFTQDRVAVFDDVQNHGRKVS